MDNFAAWMINGGRDPREMPDERDLLHRRALREAQAATGEQTGLFGRLSASVRAAFRTETPNQTDAACCAA